MGERNSIKIEWKTEDGYVGGARPQSFNVRVSDFEGMSEGEIETALGEQVQEAFAERVSWACDINKYVTMIMRALPKDEEEAS